MYWQSFLQEFSQYQLACMEDKVKATLPSQVLTSGWLGLRGATEVQITALETRLGQKLPPSYRAFLLVSNGWPGEGIYGGMNTLLMAEQVDWFINRHADWIETWGSNYNDVSIPDEIYFTYGSMQNSVHLRVEYLLKTLQISDTDGEPGRVWLLNPQVIFSDGEWEAWDFANYYPGAYRYHSFADLMKVELMFLEAQTD
ncbi:SMI1/KNR4 family protein [Fischerella sp. PCC 9605]|uniref:SMI1/KNR4 family protein n=1 Tax=Fischerella sp. PCC 9605 TaxID=1173024 RepID=UPI0004B4FC9F|nr:SMI1/KNR4 family protein [Fischerella sp. PCC 9605]